MNLEELKATWKDYDQRLTATRAIHNKIVKSMIRDKSGSTLNKMRRMCLLTILLMGVIIWFCLMSIIYNAFDYEYSLQFLPLIIYVIVAAVFIVYLIKEYQNSKVDLYNDNLKNSLNKVIALHESFMSINLKLVLIFLSAGFLYLLNASFKVLQNQGAWSALLFLSGGVILNVGMLFIAQRMGAFKDHYGDSLKNLLHELEEFEEVEIKF